MRNIKILGNRWLLLLGVVLLGLCGVQARAEESEGITVSGSGSAEAMPDVVELTAMVEGNAELAGDASEKFRGNKRRITEALNGLNIKGMTLAGAGISVNSGTPVNQMAAFQPAQANAPKVAEKVAFQERLTITIRDVNTMSADQLLQAVTRIVDVIKDAGVTMGPGPKSMIEMQVSGTKPASLATFKLSNPEPLRQQANEAAIKNARAKAERLAGLAGVKLGEIVSIREPAPAAKDTSSGGGMAAYFALLGGAATGQPEFTTTELRAIPVTANLNVQFDIVQKK